MQAEPFGQPPDAVPLGLRGEPLFDDPSPCVFQCRIRVDPTRQPRLSRGRERGRDPEIPSKPIESVAHQQAALIHFVTACL